MAQLNDQPERIICKENRLEIKIQYTYIWIKKEHHGLVYHSRVTVALEIYAP